MVNDLHTHLPIQVFTTNENIFSSDISTKCCQKYVCFCIPICSGEQPRTPLQKIGSRFALA